MFAKCLQCIKCGKEFPLNGKILTCPNHNKYYNYLEIKYDYNKIKKFPLDGKSPYKYLPLLPINKIKVTLGEGQNPLIQICVKNGANIFVKNEFQNPTGSFKDKGYMIMINKALEMGIKSLFVVSDGNAAISASAYSNKAKIKCKCFCPENTTSGKLNLIKIYGGILEKIKGSYEDVYKKCIDYEGWNCTSGFNPFHEEGDKITAFEIWEEIGVPDKIIVPCGNGSQLFGIWKGFSELKEIGKISKIPQMIGVQITGASPLKTSLKNNSDYYIEKNPEKSIAEAIVASESYSSPKAIKALLDSGGFIVTVNDTELIESLNKMIKNESLLVEPSSAAVFSALEKIHITNGENLVCILTGSGVKNMQEIIELVK
jgi:threonine synthase